MHKSRVGEITLRSSSAVQHRHANEGSESAWLSRRTARDQSISRDIAITNPRHQPPAATRHSRGISLTTIYSPAATTNSSVKRPSSSPSPLSASRTPLVDSYFSLQPASSGIEARSPANKRPPASRSSYGIETSSGPPPALSTQRTYSKESIWRLPSTNETAVDYSLLSPRILATLGPSSTTTGVAVSAGTIISTNTSLDEPSALLSTASINPENPTALLAVSDMVQKASQSEDGRQFASDDEGDRTLRASDDMEQSHNNGQQTVQTKGMHNGGKEQSQSSEEDIFLNLARAGEVVTEMTDVPGQSERRHSRIAQTAQNQSLPSNTSSSSSNNYHHTSSRSASTERENILFQNGRPLRSSIATQSAHFGLPSALVQDYRRNRQYTASAHPLDSQNRIRYSDITPRGSSAAFRRMSNHETSPDLPQAFEGRLSKPESALGIPSRRFRQSNMSFSNNKFNHSSPLNGRSAPIYEQDPTPLTPRAEGTESTVSTTAPSTVWDVVDDMNSRLRNEVDDLNSRLRKLELTGKLPSSSGAAVSNAVRERPRTATTTVTTMSPSPHGRRTTSTSPEASTIGGPNASNTHPLLQAALAKSKTSMSPTMFKALEATAADASALSAMMASPNQNGSNYDGTSVIDRRLKRKADNMCRSLTELCIAMTENPLQHDAPSVEDGLETSTQSFFSGQQQREGNTDPNRFKRGGSLEPDARPSSRVFSRIEARRTSLLGMNSVKYRASSPNDYSSDAATPVQHAIPTANALHRIPTVLLRSRRKDSNDTERKRPPLSRAMTSLDDVRPLPPQHGSREYTSQHPLPSPDPRSPSVQSSLPVRKSYFNGVSHVPSSPMVQPGSRRYLERSTTSAAESARLAEARQQRIKALGQYGSLGRQRDSSLSRRLRHAAVDSGNHNAEANSQ